MGLFADLQNRGLWDSYSRYVVALEPHLEATTARGMPVSAARHAEVAALLDTQLAQLTGDMQIIVPTELKRHQWLMHQPKAGTQVEAECPAAPQPDGRWLRVYPFTPSTKQLVAYMRHRGHRVPQHWKRQNDTTEQDELRRLYRETGDPLYGLVGEYRDAQTMRTNHIENWTPGPDGRVHPIFYHTATGQLEARKPNTMNAPHHKPTQGDLFRSIVQARDGYELVSLDYKSFHALYLAWESGDRVMERMARIDLVSFATAHFLRLPHADEAPSWPDDQLRDWLGWVKRIHGAVRDAKMKHAFHGYDNGMRAHGCYMRYRDFFDSRREVEKLLGMLDALFSVAHAWRQRIVEQAHEQGYLMSKFGCVRYFWEVKKWKGGDWSHGDDAEAAASFIQQNHAHCHLKDVMLQLGAAGWLVRAGLCTPIHDDLTFECPVREVEAALVHILPVMQDPNPTTGLAVKVELKRGKQWNKMAA